MKKSIFLPILLALGILSSTKTQCDWKTGAWATAAVISNLVTPAGRPIYEEFNTIKHLFAFKALENFVSPTTSKFYTFTFLPSSLIVFTKLLNMIMLQPHWNVTDGKASYPSLEKGIISLLVWSYIAYYSDKKFREYAQAEAEKSRKEIVPFAAQQPIQTTESECCT